MQLVDYRFEKLVLPCDPPVSDAAATMERAGVIYIELEADTGEVGLGIGAWGAGHDVADLRRRFESVWEYLEGENPFRPRNELRLPEAGDFPGPFRRPVDVGLWDLCGKHLGMPVYELMGGTDPEVPAYASGLAFGADDDTTRAVYREFADLGFDVAKVKIGYDTVEEDVERLRLVRDVLGEDATLAVDLNGTWTPKETLRRVADIRDAGIDLAWVEDPVAASDRTGIERVVEGLDRTVVNVGEYEGFDGKRALLARDAVDMLNLRTGMLTESLNAAAMGESHGVSLHVGDVQCETGVHVAAALPGDPPIEYWHRPWNRITDDCVAVEDGTMIAPDRPGHGVTLDESAIERYRETA